MFFKRLVKQAISAAVIELVGSAAQKLGEVWAEHELAKRGIGVTEQELVIETPPKKAKKK